ncbi:MAG: B12-binding domain-containing radical SAM protein [Nanoarchaeota archaeon]|nr:B12-binding domain-containing radical SAM protein [Nanoarchaeota archaeon]
MMNQNIVKQKEIDVLLVQPPLSVNERYGRDVGDVGGDLPPLGLAMLAAVIKKENYAVEIIDSFAMNYSSKDILRIIRFKNPKIIGITSITPTYHRAKQLVKEIKKEFPDILTIIGGHHITIMPEKVMEECEFDLGVCGEGEITIMEIINLYKTKKWDLKKFLLDIKALKKIDGISFKDKKNKIIINKPRKLIEDIDSLPYPARELLPMKKYFPLPNQYKRKPVIHMAVIRGCPYNCSFCSNNKIFGRKIRARSPIKSVEEIKHVIKKYNAKEISFWDDMMTVNKKWMYEFCNLLIEQKINITWTCYARVDSVDEPLLRKMKQAGCWNIFFGFESGVQELLDNINKKITLKQIEIANNLCKKIGIEVRASFMIALPGETPELAKKTIKFAKKLNPDYAQFCITTPYPGTDLYDNVNKYGTLLEDYSKFNIWEPVFIPKGYKNAKEIKKIEKQAMRQFYLRPGYVFSRIQKITSLEDIFRYLKGLRLLMGFIKKQK